MSKKLVFGVVVLTIAMLFAGCGICKSDGAKEKPTANRSVVETALAVNEENTYADEVEVPDTTSSVGEEQVSMDEMPCTADTTLPDGKDLTFKVGGVSFKMKPVEGGTFLMGAQSKNPSGDNYSLDALSGWGPVHKVTVSAFYMGETEVTQALWKAVMGKTVRQQRNTTNPSYYLRGEGNDYPMYYVSYEDCQEFVRRLNKLTGKEFRLPTEAEWEYAARGGRESWGVDYAGSDEIDEVAHYSECHESYAIEAEMEAEMKESERPGTSKVKTLTPNELGLYDMSGNVSEWCSDWEGDYPTDASCDPQGPSEGELGIVRGGGWFDLSWGCCVFARGYQKRDERLSVTGLRLVLPK